LSKIVIVGCGVVGAALAYELSLNPQFHITVIDQATPAQGSTGAALGVLMAVISHKVKGRNWRLRQQSLARYQTLLPELAAKLGQPVAHNSQGILSLCFDPEALPRWRSLQTIRQAQGYTLDIWSPEYLRDRCPHLSGEGVVAGIYSPQDLQVNPTALTQALVAAAVANGVEVYWQQRVTGLEVNPGQGTLVHTPSHTFPADGVVLAAGLGTPAVLQSLNTSLAMGPVLGQGIKLHCDRPLGSPTFQPVINGHDIHLVPLGQGDYWVGATVEFPPDTPLADLLALQPEAERLQALLDGAIAYCPALAQGEIRDRWFGLRPRPQGQAAPVIQPLPGYDHVWLATGHYRNGVLLAPATALTIRDRLEAVFN
jgi:glycine oxidase